VQGLARKTEHLRERGFLWSKKTLKEEGWRGKKGTGVERRVRGVQRVDWTRSRFNISKVF